MTCCHYALAPDMVCETLAIADGAHRGHHVLAFTTVSTTSMGVRCCCGAGLIARGNLECAIMTEEEWEDKHNNDCDFARELEDVQRDLNAADELVASLKEEVKSLEKDLQYRKQHAIEVKKRFTELLKRLVEELP